MQWFQQMRIKASLGLLLVCILFSAGIPGRGDAADPAPSRFPSLVSSLRIDSPLDFCGEAVPLHLPDVRERFEKALLISLWDRAQVVLWLKRSGLYMPHIEKILKQNNMPDDLKYVAVVESALRPHVSSSRKAVGFWQFIHSTGRKYGLVINSSIDERRNLFASTRAAVKYFKALYSMFGSWTLCAAAYNMGEDGLRSRIQDQKTSNYYHLYLPLETQLFVLKIISAKLILSNPRHYGFHLTAADRYQPLAFDRIEIRNPQRMPLLLVAQAANTPFKVIKDLNPEIRGRFLPQGNHSILIPKGASKGFSGRYRSLVSKWTPKVRKRIYVVKRGDNLSTIARRFKVPLKSVRRWNQLKEKKSIHPGDRLVIYQKR